jgi:hypothetical protein
VLLFSVVVVAQHSNDTLLFQIKLNGNPGSLFYCKWGGESRDMLSGPVLAGDGNLLFYSQHGYVLYDERGKLLDFHSLHKKNRKLTSKGKMPVRLAYPYDDRTMVYYQMYGERSDSAYMYRKRLKRRWMRKVKKHETLDPEHIHRAQLFNLAGNTITDEMKAKVYPRQHLVGYTSLDDGKKWWSLDKFYSFQSPVIAEEEGELVSFFAGIRKGADDGVNKSLIEPRGVFRSEGYWYYCGVYSQSGSTRDQNFQRLYICDAAGNVLSSNKLLKNAMDDDVVGEVESEKMLYTVKRAARHAFLPAVDTNGVIYFGVIDYPEKRIDIMKRVLYRYHPIPSGPGLEDSIHRELSIFMEPDTVACPIGNKPIEMLPRFHFNDSLGISHPLTEHDLVRQGFVAKIFRVPNSGLDKKLRRRQRALPDHVRHKQDSLAALSTASCPYGVMLQKDGTEFGRFYYNVGDELMSARVLRVTRTYEVFIRVDLRDRAEILVFYIDGSFLNRFTFNHQDYADRLDVVSVSEQRDIFEKDYEVADDAYRYYTWKLGGPSINRVVRRK